jgi:hypothetical protein
MKNNSIWAAIVFLLAFLTCIVANAGSCYEPRVVNMTGSWDTHDNEVLMSAKAGGCKRHFKDMPCLKLFIKLNKNDYSVICGHELNSAIWRAYGIPN